MHKFSTPTRGGDAFGMNLPNDAFEGLALGVSQRRHIKGRRQPPLRIGLDLMKGIHEAFVRRQVCIFVSHGFKVKARKHHRRPQGQGYRGDD
jgi:hypothetical protein